MATIAIVMTVKNEQELLRSNILYHHYLGVKLFYVFLDRTTDDTKDTVADLDYVVLSDSISAHHFLESDGRREACAASPRLRDMIARSEQHHTARQVLNAYLAWEKARDDGIEWLISVDADELVYPGVGSITEGQLAQQLDGIERHVDQVRFRPLEIVQEGQEYESIFREAILFKRYGSRIPREVYDPLTKKRRKFEFVPTRFHRLGLYRLRRFNWWYGHHEGKWAVRIGPSIVPLVHHCERLDGSLLVTIHAFYLLHYLMYDYNDFIKKYRNIAAHLDNWASGFPAPYRKRLWRDVVNHPSFSNEELYEYYRRWIAFDKVDFQDRLKGQNEASEADIIEVTAVRDVFDKLCKRDELSRR